MANRDLSFTIDIDMQSLVGGFRQGINSVVSLGRDAADHLKRSFGLAFGQKPNTAGVKVALDDVRKALLSSLDPKALASQWDAGMQKVAASIREGTAALAQMKAAGQGGTPAFKALESEVKSSIAEMKRLEKAQHDVEAKLNRAPPMGFFEKLKAGISGSNSAMGGFLGSLTGGALAGGIGALATGVFELGKKMVGGNAEMETYETQLKTLLGSAKAAKERIAELKKFGAETPFEVTDLVKAEKVLIGFGLQGDVALKKTGRSATQLRTEIGDMAAGTGQKFDELAGLFGKFSSGATGEAISRLQELGIVTREQLKAVGVEFSKSGELTSPLDVALAKSLDIAKKKFGGGMKDLSSTAAGMWSTFQDTIGEILRTVGEPIFAVAKQLLGGLSSILGSAGFQTLIKGLSDAFGKLLPPIIQVFSDMGTVIGDTMTSVGPMIGELATLLAGALGEALGEVFSAIRTAIPPIMSILPPLIKHFVDLAKLLTPFVPIILLPLTISFRAMGAVLTVVAPVINIVIAVVNGLVKGLLKLVELAEGVGDFFSGIFGGAEDAAEATEKLTENVIAAGNATSSAGAAMGTAFESMFKSAKKTGDETGKLGSTATAQTPGVEKLAESYSKLKESMGSAYSNAFGGVMALRQQERDLARELKTYDAETEAMKKGKTPVQIAMLEQERGQFRKFKADRLAAIPGEIRAEVEAAKNALKEQRDLEAMETRLKLEIGEIEPNIEKFGPAAAKVRREVAQIMGGILISNIDDEWARAKADIQAKAEADIASIGDHIKEIKAKRDGQTDTEKVQGANEYIAALESKQRAIQAQANNEAARKKEELDKKRLEDYKRLLAAEAAATKSGVQLRIQQLQQELELTTGETSAAIEKRFQIAAEIQGRQQQLALQDALGQNAQYVEAYAKLKEAEVALGSAKDDKERAAAQAQVSAARGVLDTLRVELLQHNDQMLLIQRDYGAQREKLSRETEKKVAEALAMERIAALESLHDQERELALLEMEKRFREEREKHAGNAAKLRDIDRREAAERLKIEDDYRQKNNDAEVIARAFIASMHEAFNDDLEADREEELQKRRDELQREEDDLKASLENRLISYKDYNARLGEIAQKRAELDKERAGKDQKWYERLYTATLKGLSGMSGFFSKKLEENSARLGDSIGKVGEKITVDTDALLKGLGKVGTDTLGLTLSVFGAMAATGKATLGDFGDAALLQILNTVEGIVAANLVAIFSTAISLLGPIGGVIAAGGAVALVQGLLSVAKADIQGRLGKKGFYKGIVDIDGPGTTTSDEAGLYWLSKSESVITAKGTLAPGNKEFFSEYANNGLSVHDWARDNAPQFRQEAATIIISQNVTGTNHSKEIEALHATTKQQAKRIEKLHERTQLQHKDIKTMRDHLKALVDHATTPKNDRAPSADLGRALSFG
jgi:hypothetical protein